MNPVLHTLLAIALLRGRAQDLPASRALVLATAFAAFATDFLLDRIHDDAFERLRFAATQTLLMGAVVWLALRLKGVPERWRQSIAPLYAGSALINLLSFPVLALVRPDRPAADAVWALLLGFAMTVWFLAIMVRVLREALETSLALSVLAAFACLLTSGVALAVLYPELLPR